MRQDASHFHVGDASVPNEVGVSNPFRSATHVGGEAI
ncbi:hypothetical protein SAMN04489740_1114 [Arthrobacter alpinus]|uniref:Uncharacterized protein n=1 Tax=Arthrobacter alpinus TaxID=656366 RepID=A0A1H5HUS4_9MICC|nr:hypothetical protein SAMN04489740_1114 [Arthrobacter alpinus]